MRNTKISEMREKEREKEREREREEGLIFWSSLVSCSTLKSQERRIGGKHLFNPAFSHGIRMEFNKVKLSLFLFIFFFYFNKRTCLSF